MTLRSRPRRQTHCYSGELVVFLIGMRVNRWWRIDQWLPVFRAMPGMLRELEREPDSGLLGHRVALGEGGPFVVMYWNDRSKLYDYATEPTALHRPAWTAFNRRARNAGDAVGIWHETYGIADAESIYVGMKPFGLGRATAVREVTAAGDRARSRITANAPG